MSEPPLAPPGAVLETCLYADPLERTARFFEDVLGLEVVGRVEGRHVFFRCGSGMFLLFDPERALIPGGDVPPHGGSAGGHVAFAVPTVQIARWRERFAGAGVEVEREVTWPGGGRSLYVRDPSGNSVELTSPTIWRIAEDDVFGRGPATGSDPAA